MNLHIIIGGDDYRVAEAAKKVIGDGVGLEVIDSMNSGNAETQLADIREADASFSTPPFLEPKKVTWWKNVHFLPGGGGKKAVAADVKAALEKFATRMVAAPLPDNQHFILSGPGLLKTSIFAKTLASAAEMVVFAAEKPWEAKRSAAARAEEFAAAENLKFEPGAAERFVSVVGVDTRSLRSEIDKLRDYLGAGAHTITAADIAEVTSQGAGVEPEFWSVTDAIGERDIGKAVTALRKFELESGFPVFMSAVIESFFRQLIEVKNGRTEGMSPFAVRKNEGFLRHWDLNELRVARWRFLTLRENIVSGVTDGENRIFTELVRVCRRRR